jgi:flagellin
MLNINTNYAAAFASNAAKKTTASIETAMERLSTGSRINYSRDDAAGLAIATRLNSEVQSLSAASRNAADAQSMLDTTDGALAETHSVLIRMRELAVQAANGTLDDTDRAALDAEFQQLESEIDRINSNTSFAGVSLFDGSAKTFHIGTGNAASDKVSHTFTSLASHNLDLDTAGPDDVLGGSSTDDVVRDLTSAANAQTMLGEIDTAIATVSTERGKLGALSNRLSSTVANLDQIGVNLFSSKGRIQDADFAAETSNLAKGQILQQAATAMLAQANVSKSNVLSLIQN